MAQSLNIKIYYWTVDKNIINNKIDDIKQDKKWLLSNYLQYGKTYQDIIKENGGLRIIDETDGIIIDDHMALSGHKVLADLFLNYIKQ